jgi:hypothetical protein
MEEAHPILEILPTSTYIGIEKPLSANKKKTMDDMLYLSRMLNTVSQEDLDSGRIQYIENNAVIPNELSPLSLPQKFVIARNLQLGGGGHNNPLAGTWAEHILANCIDALEPNAILWLSFGYPHDFAAARKFLSNPIDGKDIDILLNEPNKKFDSYGSVH